mmetsp:Transcript_52589/g.153281  ORF Transcript_52589/g.153281 Transcript_52589/m.153281 type:complete len:482 (-) Transcript_52589:1428-2873(-)
MPPLRGAVDLREFAPDLDPGIGGEPILVQLRHEELHLLVVHPHLQLRYVALEGFQSGVLDLDRRLLPVRLGLGGRDVLLAHRLGVGVQHRRQEHVHRDEVEAHHVSKEEHNRRVEVMHEQALKIVLTNHPVEEGEHRCREGGEFGHGPSEDDVEEEGEADEGQAHDDGEIRVADLTLVQSVAERRDPLILAHILHDLDRDEKAVQSRDGQASAVHLRQLFELHEDVPVVLEASAGVRFFQHAELLDVVVGHRVLPWSSDAEVIVLAEALEGEGQDVDDRHRGQAQRHQVAYIPKVGKEGVDELHDVVIHLLDLRPHVDQVVDHIVEDQQGIYRENHDEGRWSLVEVAAATGDVEREALCPGGLDELARAKEAEAHNVVGEAVQIPVVGHPVEHHGGRVSREPPSLAGVAQGRPSLVERFAEAKGETPEEAAGAELVARPRKVEADRTCHVRDIHLLRHQHKPEVQRVALVSVQGQRAADIV